MIPASATLQQLAQAGFAWPDAPAPNGATFPTGNAGGLGQSISYLQSNPVGIDPSSPQVQAALKAIQQYDPNASFTGSLGGDNNTMTYQLSFEPSLLPNVNGTGALARGPIAGRSGETGFELPFSQTPSNTNAMFDPSLTYDSGAYGNVTPNANVRQIPSTGLFGLADKMLPYAVMSVLGYGAGAAGSSLLGAAGLGGSLGSGLGRTLGNFVLSDLVSGGNAKFNPLSLVGAVGPSFGLPSWVPSAVGTLSGLAQGRGLQFNPYALAARFAPYLFGGGGGGG